MMFTNARAGLAWWRAYFEWCERHPGAFVEKEEAVMADEHCSCYDLHGFSPDPTCKAHPKERSVAAHSKKCKLCRKHDRRVGEHFATGVRYTAEEEARYRAHIKETVARIRELAHG